MYWPSTFDSASKCEKIFSISSFYIDNFFNCQNLENRASKVKTDEISIALHTAATSPLIQKPFLNFKIFCQLFVK